MPRSLAPVSRVRTCLVFSFLLVAACSREEPFPDHEDENQDEEGDGANEAEGDKGGSESGGDTGGGGEESSGTDGGSSTDDAGSDETGGSETGDEGGTGDTGTGDTGTDDTGTDDTGTDDTGADDTGTDDTDTDDTGTGDTGDDEGESDDSGTDPPTECQEDQHCEAPTPFCEGDQCVDCTGLVTSTCADKNPAVPACREDDGVCVQCTAEDDRACSGTTPICGADNTCRGCQEHDECPFACDLDTGGCLDGPVMYVSGSECVADNQLGTRDYPYCRTRWAIEQVGSRETGIIVVRGGPGVVYRDSIVVTSGQTVVLVGEEEPRISATSGDAAIQVGSEAKAYISGFHVETGRQIDGVSCTLGTVWVDDTRIEDTLMGVRVDSECDLHIRRGTIADTVEQGVYMRGGTLSVEGSKFIDNELAALDIAGVNASMVDSEVSGVAFVEGISIDDEARVSITRVSIQGAFDNGIYCFRSTLELDEVSVIGAWAGVAARNCEFRAQRLAVSDAWIGVHGSNMVIEDSRIFDSETGLSVSGSARVDRTFILGNQLAGVIVYLGGHVEMSNSIVAGNGTAIDVDVENGGIVAREGTFDVSYSTITGNKGSASGGSIDCDESTGATGSIRNSIIVTESVGSVRCPGISVIDSAVRDPDIIDGNTDVGPWNPNWFVDVNALDFRLGDAKQTFEGIARWRTGDPETDIEGDPRPTVNDTPDWPGADVPE